MKLGPFAFFRPVWGGNGARQPGCYTLVSLHWKRSITWRWALYRWPNSARRWFVRGWWKPYGAISAGVPLVGELHFNWQPNCWRSESRP